MTSINLHSQLSSRRIPQSLKGKILDSSGTAIETIDKLSKVNLFIGANNSGKSLFARKLIGEHKLDTFLSGKSLNEFNKIVFEYKERFSNFLVNHEITEIRDTSRTDNFVISSSSLDEVFQKLNAENFVDDYLSRIDSLIQTWPAQQRIQFRILKHGNQWVGHRTLPNSLIQFINELKDRLFSKLSAFVITKDPDIYEYYFPTLRTLRVFDAHINNRNYGSHVLAGQINKEYFQLDPSDDQNPHLIQHVETLTGENLFDEIIKQKTSTSEEEDKLFAFQDFLSKNFFDDKKIRLVPNGEEKVVNITIEGEPERAIHDLGDGLQMVIILTFPLFLYEKGIITVEEPELFLHAGLQRKVIEIFGSHPKSENFQFYLVSHSNHILDAVLEEKNSTIYSFEKIPQSNHELPYFKIHLVDYGNRNVLDLLGINNTSVFLSNCTIWVEGVTDKLYLKRMIDVYLNSNHCKPRLKESKSYKEGLAYNFLYTSGDNIIHYDFSDSESLKELQEDVPVHFICGRSMVIVDDDYDKNPERKRQLKNKLKLRFYELPCVEIESILHYEVIINTIKEWPSWKKLDLNSLPSINQKSYRNKRLGSLIDNKILKDQVRTRKTKLFSLDKEKSNQTINCKLDFCKKSIKHINQKRLTEDSVELVESILDFIREHNPK